MSTGSDLIALIASRQNLADYQKKHWDGTFEDYLDIVRADPEVTRNAFQRLYDMILSATAPRSIIDNKEKLIRYKFFDDPIDGGQRRHLRPRRPADAAWSTSSSPPRSGYGTEKRVLLLHGPVGSSKSTIARLLKKGLEATRAPTEGALYTFGWRARGRGSTASDDVRSTARCTRSRCT